MKCSKCGQNISWENLYCFHCGHIKWLNTVVNAVFCLGMIGFGIAFGLDYVVHPKAGRTALLLSALLIGIGWIGIPWVKAAGLSGIIHIMRSQKENRIKKINDGDLIEEKHDVKRKRR